MPVIGTVADVLRQHGTERADEAALRCAGRETAWAELDRRSSRIANALIEQGVEPGDRVAFLGRNSDTYFECFYGTVKAGATFVAVNWRLTGREVGHILADSRARVVFADEDSRSVAEAASESVGGSVPIVILDAARTSFAAWRDAHLGDDPGRDVAEADVLQLYTSGTTGRPKGALIGNRYVFGAVGVARSSPVQHQTITPPECGLVVLPLFHIGGLAGYFVAFFEGCTVVVLPEFSAEGILDALRAQRVPLLNLVPAALQLLLDSPGATPRAFADVRFVIDGGSPMPPALLRLALERMGCQFAQGYGMTEICYTTLLPPDDHDANGNERMLSVGRALPGVDVKILGPDDREVPTGTIGQIAVKSPSMMSGYWNLPDETAAAFTADGYIRTGDGGVLDAAGYLYLKDRIRDFIISGGENVYPSEVEAAIYEHPSIAEAAIVGVADDRWGEVPKAFIVLRPGRDITLEELAAFLSDRLARFKIPKHLELIDQLPRNAAGKVLRRELRT